MMFTATVNVPQRLVTRSAVTRWAPGVFELKLTRHYQVIDRVSNFWWSPGGEPRWTAAFLSSPSCVALRFVING